VYRRIALLLVCLVLLAAQSPRAQTVEQLNALVFYFDENATERSWYGTGEVTAYLIAGPLVYSDNGLHYHEFLNSWSCWGLDARPFENLSLATLTMRGEAIPASVELGPQPIDLDVILVEPLPLTGRTVVAELALNVVATERTELWAWGDAFTADGMANGFVQLTSGPDGPMDMTGHTANINADAPVGTEHLSWSQVKALYR